MLRDETWRGSGEYSTNGHVMFYVMMKQWTGAIPPNILSRNKTGKRFDAANMVKLMSKENGAVVGKVSSFSGW